MRNYISKINDRNIQRKRESGLTTYALFSVLIIILYKIIQLYPKIQFKESFWQVTIILTYTFNILFAFLVIYWVYEMTLGDFSSSRVMVKTSQKERLLEHILDLSISLIPMVSNIAVWAYYFFLLQKFNWYFFVLSASFLFIVVMDIVISFQESKIKKQYEVIEGTGTVGTDKNILSILFYTISCVCISISFWSIFNETLISNKLNIMVFGVLFFSIPYLLDIIIELRKTDNFAVALENLEYEINVRNLTDDEIRERLQKNYMGFLLIEWVNYNITELDKFKTEIDKQIEELQVLKEDIENLDAILYPIEYEGRKGNYDKRKMDISKNIESFFKGKLHEIRDVWTDSKLDGNERKELFKLYDKMKSEFETYKRN
jgi:hypothetical protein